MQNAKAVKISKASHKIAASLSHRFGISMSALVGILLRQSEHATSLQVPEHGSKRGK
jgi:hypothetical protein